MTTHELKILPAYFKAVSDGSKTFEIRKNDRDYKVGDYVVLKEFDGINFTGYAVPFKISYIIQGGEHGLEKDYVILAIKDIYQ